MVDCPNCRATLKKIAHNLYFCDLCKTFYYIEFDEVYGSVAFMVRIDPRTVVDLEKRGMERAKHMIIDNMEREINRVLGEES